MFSVSGSALTKSDAQVTKNRQELYQALFNFELEHIKKTMRSKLTQQTHQAEQFQQILG